MISAGFERRDRGRNDASLLGLVMSENWWLSAAVKTVLQQAEACRRSGRGCKSLYRPARKQGPGAGVNRPGLSNGYSLWKSSVMLAVSKKSFRDRAVHKAYIAQVQLLVRILPFVARETDFALKGGTAINLFYRGLPGLRSRLRCRR